MAALLFDTHKAVKELQEAGFEEAQAEAVVATVGTAIIGNVATKQDLVEVRAQTKQDLAEVRAQTKQDLADARAETKQDIADARAETKQDINGLRSEMQAMELRITLRMGGLIVAGVGLIIALDKLL